MEQESRRTIMIGRYVIYPLLMARFASHERALFTYRKNLTVRDAKAPLLVYLVRGNGKNILFDSGPIGPDKSAGKSHRSLVDHLALPDALAAKGLKLEEIHCVVLSHLHWDHSYNLEYFPNVPIYVQARELSYAIHPMPCDRATYNVRQKNGPPQWFAGYENMRVLEGDKKLSDGLEILFMPGHTPGLQCLLVSTSAGNCLLASDHFPLMENYLDEIPSGIHTDLREWYASTARAKSAADYILPGHDDAALQQESYGI
jgi:glyoxylase-like metal-dependent hydrolase (beta-lactamase superfamily II)